ncbi:MULTISPECIES: hypothetical protein [unclassified Sphingobium]|jgi:glycine/D-amino acid oxidase-like deaminating enzyme|uniref:hypothetical protein n=1 Tax=unclassified Sphingobium TaxID=2611147 RepID=UPI00105E458D
MSWTTIRLELARTAGFPNGSAARSYVLRLPLSTGGLIDEREYRVNPELATARRFWPNEPDRHGTLLHTRQGWALSCKPGEADDEKIYRLEAQAIQLGTCLTLTDPDGESLPFVVKGFCPA